MTPTYEEIKAARGECSECGGEGKDATDDRPDAETWDCPTCHGTGNRILTFLIPMDVPDGYEYDKKFDRYTGFDGTIYFNFIHRKFVNTYITNKFNLNIEAPYKINQPIPVMCDACGGDGVRWYHQSIKRDPHASFNDRHFKKPCPVCNGSPETTLTVIGIQVVNNKSYITEKADKDNPYGKRVLKNKWYFKVKVLEGL